MDNFSDTYTAQSSEDASSDAVAATQKPQRHYLSFTGSGGEYFKIWIVNILLTIITLGIYSAWAKVRTNQYFYGNTILDNASFQYLAKPLNILKGRIIAVTVLIVYSVIQNIYIDYAPYAFLVLMCLVPGMIVLAMSFRLRNTAYRNITFHFDRDFKKAYLLFAIPVILLAVAFIPQMSAMNEYTQQTALVDEYNVALEDAWNNDGEISPSEGEQLDRMVAEHQLVLDTEGFAVAPELPVEMAWFGLVMLVIMFLYPIWERVFTRFKVNSSQFGRSAFHFDASTWQFYKMYLLATGIVIGLSIFVGLMSGVISSITGNPFITGVITGLLLMPVYMFMYAFIQVYKHNLMVNNSTLGDAKLVSELDPIALTWIYLSNTLIVILSAGLATPWAAVRVAAYKAEKTSIFTSSPLTQYVAKEEDQRSALGEEMGEAFDLDLGF
jgi:uncharacterized membrane protein YjgN (DUF898 family)